jgi:uncharacterized protein
MRLVPHTWVRSLTATSLLGLVASGVALSACATHRAPDASAESTRASSASAAPGTGIACIGPGPQAKHPSAKNVAGLPLAPCPSKHTTGFYRDGYCSTGDDDRGVHVVCAQVTDKFLEYSRAQGNDLVSPRASFPGLKAGDAWCLCAARWQEALQAGVAPPVYSASTDERALSYVKRADLAANAMSDARETF